METKIVICGSYRKQLKEIGIAVSKFKEAKADVLAPLTNEAVNEVDDFVILTTDNPQKTAEDLEKDVLIKIRNSSFLYIANIDGYIGRSATAEMCLAVLENIPIVTAENIYTFSKDVPSTISDILKNGVFKCLPINDINSSKITELSLSEFVPIITSIEQKEILNLFINNLLEWLRGIKI